LSGSCGEGAGRRAAFKALAHGGPTRRALVIPPRAPPFLLACVTAAAARARAPAARGRQRVRACSTDAPLCSAMSEASEPVDVVGLGEYFLGVAGGGEAAAAEGGGDEAEAEAAQRDAADEDEAWGERGLSGSAAESAGEEEEETATAREGGGRGRGRGRGRPAGRTGAKRSKKVGAAANRHSYGTKHSHLIASVMRRMNQFGVCR